MSDGHKYITDRLRARCTPDAPPEIRALLNEAATVIEGRDTALRGSSTFAALKQIVSHWDEFGHEHGLDEHMDIARGLVNRAQGG